MTPHTPSAEMLAENAALAADLENVQTELDAAELRIKELESRLAASSPDYAAGLEASAKWHDDEAGKAKLQHKKLDRYSDSESAAWYGWKRREDSHRHHARAIRALPVPDGREEIQSDPHEHHSEDFEPSDFVANATGDDWLRDPDVKDALHRRPADSAGQEPFAWADVEDRERPILAATKARYLKDSNRYCIPLYTAQPSLDREAIARAIKELHHVANEWADAATNGQQWLRNIVAGISTPDEAMKNMDKNIAHCVSVRDSALSLSAILSLNTGDGQTRAEIIEELRAAVETSRQAIQYSLDMGCTDPSGVLLQAINKCDRALAEDAGRKGS